ncbi:probable long-chain-alcohol O-fatty-acyltransferase 5 [Eucalyptus grandis]|uniref:probable long-chain-alcohol O-fatty-acyltransferase 5 n=1 Tax=Eucalyptus grandis TaxID=71139 RepID=UPI00192EDF6C|nr:probable long-chain-alcohol O-fatty-acyltransferase 5 [Eucalyptus grandis]
MYNPVRSALVCLVGRQWAALPTVLTGFAALALMHELMLYHIGRKEVAWVIARFFLLHGVAVAAKVTAKKALRSTRWQRLLAEVSRVLMERFVVMMGFWLFPPPLLPCDVAAKAGRETIAVVEFVKGLWNILRFISRKLASGP